MEWLDPSKFFGFIENPDKPDEHFHLQRARNTIFTVEDLLNG
jgi:hypothetical protein